MPCNFYTMAYTPTLCLVFLYDTVYAEFLLWTVCHKAVETIHTIQGILFYTQLKTVTSLSSIYVCPSSIFCLSIGTV